MKSRTIHLIQILLLDNKGQICNILDNGYNEINVSYRQGGYLSPYHTIILIFLKERKNA